MELTNLAETFQIEVEVFNDGDYDGNIKIGKIRTWGQRILSRFMFAFRVRNKQIRYPKCKLILQFMNAWRIDDFDHFQLPDFYLELFDFAIVILVIENL